MFNLDTALIKSSSTAIQVSEHDILVPDTTVQD